MSTIYEKTAGSLIAQPDRSVATFDSGLIRVDQAFLCTTASAETNRLSLAVGNSFPGETSPAIDGLFIFPSPQESRTGDGLTKFMVSGYGRATDQFISQRRGTTSTVIKSSYITPDTIDNRDFAIITANSLVGKIAILDEDGLTFAQLNLDPSFSEPILVIPVDASHVIRETARASRVENAVNWDGQIYSNLVTTVRIEITLPEFIDTDLVGFYTYSTPLIGIDFSTSYGKLTELGINVSVPIGNPTDIFTLE
jgi:hypothetical protein